MYIFIAYLSLFTLFILYHLIYVIKFYIQSKKNNAVLSFDKYDLITNICLFFTSITLNFYYSIKVSTIDNNYIGFIYSPFFYFSILMLIALRLGLLRSMFSYNNNRFFAFGININIKSLKLLNFKKELLGLNNFTATLSYGNKKSNKITIVTSKNNFDKLKAFRDFKLNN